MVQGASCDIKKELLLTDCSPVERTLWRVAGFYLMLIDAAIVPFQETVSSEELCRAPNHCERQVCALSNVQQ